MSTSIITPRGTVVVRHGRVDDAPAYRELRLAMLCDHPTAFSSDYAVNEAHPMSFWIDRLERSGQDDAALLVFAVHEEQLIGMCGLYTTTSPKLRHSADIVSMYVRPEWRGLHLAESLIEACLDWARTRGIRVVKLGVTGTNAPAIRCYTRCGFHVYGVEPQAVYHDGNYYDELLMARAI